MTDAELDRRLEALEAQAGRWRTFQQVALTVLVVAGPGVLIFLLMALFNVGGGNGPDFEREHRLDGLSTKLAVEDIQRQITRLHERLDTLASKP
jgi:hypothetical protein